MADIERGDGHSIEVELGDDGLVKLGFYDEDGFDLQSFYVATERPTAAEGEGPGQSELDLLIEALERVRTEQAARAYRLEA